MPRTLSRTTTRWWYEQQAEPHEHAVVGRAISLEERLLTDARYRPDRGALAARPDLTLEQFDMAWKRVARGRGLPMGLGSSAEERGGAVVATEITPVVGLIAALDEDGLISGITLTGRGEGLYDTYDTVFAWSVLLETLFPDKGGEIWAGSFDSLLYLSGSEVRGYDALVQSRSIAASQSLPRSRTQTAQADCPDTAFLPTSRM